MVNRPRGTRDFDPDEMAVRKDASQRIRRALGRFGYQEVQTPTFEELELFTAKSGDGIVSELYDFEDKGGRRMCLRPELTAPVMRMYFQEHAFDPKPLKWYYHGPCFRYDRPQAGRYREFWQFGVEQIGAGTPLAYAELIALADSLLATMGLQSRELLVGHVGILKGLVAATGVADETRGQVMRAIDKGDIAGAIATLRDGGGDTDALERLEAALEATDIQGLQAVIGHGSIPPGDGEAATDGRSIAQGSVELEAVFTHLNDFQVPAGLNIGIARGLDYYTGPVFEVHCPALEAQSQLLGGGGYDLSTLFGGQPTPTMGFGLGFDRLLVALEAEGATPPSRVGPAVYVGALSDATVPRVVRLARALRAQGLDVDMDLMGRKPGQIAKHADNVDARYLAIIGDRDIENGTVAVKDLHSGEQETVAIDDLEHHLLEESGAIDMADYN